MTEPLDLAPIRARLAAATGGPWTAVEWDAGIVRIVAAHPIGEMYGDLASATYDGLADASFTAHAREDIPALIAEVERLQRLVVAVLHVDEDRRVGDYLLGLWADIVVHADECDCNHDDEQLGAACALTSNAKPALLHDQGGFAPTLLMLLPPYLSPEQVAEGERYVAVTARTLALAVDGHRPDGSVASWGAVQDASAELRTAIDQARRPSCSASEVIAKTRRGGAEWCPGDRTSYIVSIDDDVLIVRTAAQQARLRLDRRPWTAERWAAEAPPQGHTPGGYDWWPMVLRPLLAELGHLCTCPENGWNPDCGPHPAGSRRARACYPHPPEDLAATDSEAAT